MTLLDSPVSVNSLLNHPVTNNVLVYLDSLNTAAVDLLGNLFIPT